MSEDEFKFMDSDVKAPEVLNNIMDNKNIAMKTRVNIEHIRAFSLFYYRELIDKRKEKNMSARQCFNEAGRNIQELLCSRDDKHNRTVLVKEALQNMNVVKTENTGQAAALPMR